MQRRTVHDRPKSSSCEWLDAAWAANVDQHHMQAQEMHSQAYLCHPCAGPFAMVLAGSSTTVRHLVRPLDVHERLRPRCKLPWPS